MQYCEIEIGIFSKFLHTIFMINLPDLPELHHRRQVNVYDAEYSSYTPDTLNNVGATTANTKCPKPDFDVMSGRNLWHACL